MDEHHVTSSNQFFGKTAGKLRENPQACIIVVEAISGRQVRLAAIWLCDEAEGPLFDATTASLRASSAQIGMGEVMRLASVAIFLVETITALPHPEGLDAPPPGRSRLAESPQRLAFRQEDAILLSMVANHAAATLLIGEELACEAANSRKQTASARGITDVPRLILSPSPGSNADARARRSRERSLRRLGAGRSPRPASAAAEAARAYDDCKGYLARICAG